MNTETENEGLVNLGTWLGRHQAFGIIANRCTAADAECLRAIREGGEYKKLGLTWAAFCEQRAGVSRGYADRLIRHLEEFGANYFKLAELIQISSDTYRLIAGSVSDAGLEHNGEQIPITAENRKKLLSAVQSAREERHPRKVYEASKRLNAFVAEVSAMAIDTQLRLELISLVETSVAKLSRLGAALRSKTLVV